MMEGKVKDTFHERFVVLIRDYVKFCKKAGATREQTKDIISFVDEADRDVRAIDPVYDK